MPPGLDNLKHIVVLMMENRSFDHMLGSLKAVDARIDGVTDQLSNPDTTGASVNPQPLAEFQGQLDPDPDHHFPAVDLQIFGGDTQSEPRGEYAGVREELFQSAGGCEALADDHVLLQAERLARADQARRWSLRCSTAGSLRFPGPTICNRAFAHYGTSFGQVDMDPFDVIEPIKSIYTRLINATPKHTAKIYYYDTTSSTMEVVNLLQNQPELFGTYKQFLSDCDKNSAAGVFVYRAEL